MRSLLWTVLSPGLKRVYHYKRGQKETLGTMAQLTGGTASIDTEVVGSVEGALSDNPHPLPLGVLFSSFLILFSSFFKIKIV